MFTSFCPGSATRATGVVVFSAIVLCACSGGGAPLGGTPQSVTQQSSASTPRIATANAKSGTIVFAADQGGRGGSGAAVYAFSGSGTFPELWELSGAPLEYPAGLYVDGATNLYVADLSGSVFEYDAPGAAGPPGAPSFTYSDSGRAPNSVAVCGDYVYASDGAGFTVWQKGTAAPLRTVAYSNGTAAVACDAKYVYAGYDASYAGPGEVDRWPAGGGGKPSAVDVSVAYLNSLALNKPGSVLVTGAISFFTARTGKLVRTLTAPWIHAPAAFAYAPRGLALWDADAGSNALNLFTPKGKGRLLGSIPGPTSGSFQLLTGVAVSPPDHD